jgi:Tfp pilus assembly protein PilF
MSLLLQALQKATKSRETTQQPSTPLSPAGTSSAVGGALELEPGEIEPSRRAGTDFEALAPKAAARTPDPEPSGERIKDFATATPPQAAAVLAATGSRAKQESRFANAMAWAREHPVHVFAGIALIFLLGYGAYVYLAVTNPALFTGGASGGKPDGAMGPLAKGPQSAGPAPAAESGRPATSGLILDELTPGAGANGQPAGAPAAVQEAATPPAPEPVTQGQPTGDGGTPAATDASTATPAAAPSPAEPGAPARAEPNAVATATTPPVSAGGNRAAVSVVPTRASGTPAAQQAPEPFASAAGTGPRTARPKRSAARSSPVDEEDRLQIRSTDLSAVVAAALAEGYEAFQAGQFPKAREAYERALSADGRNTDAMIGLAAIAWQEGRTETASEYYYRVLQVDPQHAQAQAGLIGLMGRVDPVASESRLKQLIARDPSDTLYFTLGNLHADQRQWPAAQQAYFQAFQLDPTNPDYAYNLAVGLEHLGQPKLALGYYRKALELSRLRGRAGFDPGQVNSRIDKLSLAVER